MHCFNDANDEMMQMMECDPLRILSYFYIQLKKMKI